MRRAVFLIAALLVGAAAVYAILSKLVAVDLAAVDRGPLEVTVDEEGMTRIREVYVLELLDELPQHERLPVGRQAV